MLVAAKDSLVPSSFSMVNIQAIWKKIWKIKVPNKTRHFIWHATKDSLPLNRTLWLGIYLLMMSMMDARTMWIMHYLWLCNQAGAVWLSDPRFNFMVQKN